jgi:6-methylsalicylate decarboxylase
VSARRIDVHHHYVTDDVVDELGRVGIHYVGGQPLAASRFEDSVAVMDRHEIDTAFLSAPAPLTFDDAATSRRLARSLNESGARAVADHPGRFGLIATLPLPDVDGGLSELAYALDTLRADGIVLLSNYRGVYLGDKRLEPIFAELDRRACVALVHPAVSTGQRPPTDPSAGSPVPTLEPSLFEFVVDTTRAVANLVIGGTLKRHPHVRLILAHAGGTIPCDRVLDRAPILTRIREAREGRAAPPSPEELQAMMAEGLADSRRQLQRLFYDTTLSANDTVLDCLAGLVPSTQLLLGTDYPMAQEIGVTSTLAGLARHRGFHDDDRRAIAADNARRLFPRLAAEAIGSTNASPGAGGLQRPSRTSSSQTHDGALAASRERASWL